MHFLGDYRAEMEVIVRSFGSAAIRESNVYLYQRYDICRHQIFQR